MVIILMAACASNEQKPADESKLLCIASNGRSYYIIPSSGLNKNGEQMSIDEVLISRKEDFRACEMCHTAGAYQLRLNITIDEFGKARRLKVNNSHSKKFNACVGKVLVNSRFPAGVGTEYAKTVIFESE